jgi:hypothetical protein
LLSAEHIYEGNWIRDFIQHLVDEKYPAIDGSTVGDDTKCKGAVNTFGNKLGVVIDTKTPRDAGNYSEALMQNLGTTWTSGERMALLPQIQNSMKYDVSHRLSWWVEEISINNDRCSTGIISMPVSARRL